MDSHLISPCGVQEGCFVHQRRAGTEEASLGLYTACLAQGCEFRISEKHETLLLSEYSSSKDGGTFTSLPRVFLPTVSSDPYHLHGMMQFYHQSISLLQTIMVRFRGSEWLTITPLYTEKPRPHLACAPLHQAASSQENSFYVKDAVTRQVKNTWHCIKEPLNLLYK